MCAACLVSFPFAGLVRAQTAPLTQETWDQGKPHDEEHDDDCSRHLRYRLVSVRAKHALVQEDGVKWDDISPWALPSRLSLHVFVPRHWHSPDKSARSIHVRARVRERERECVCV